MTDIEHNASYWGGDGLGLDGDFDFAAWLARWEAQRARYSIDREGRFGILVDALEAIVGAGPRGWCRHRSP
jgi:hypothetical protein